MTYFFFVIEGDERLRYTTKQEQFWLDSENSTECRRPTAGTTL